MMSVLGHPTQGSVRVYLPNVRPTHSYPDVSLVSRQKQEVRKVLINRSWQRPVSRGRYQGCPCYWRPLVQVKNHSRGHGELHPTWQPYEVTATEEDNKENRGPGGVVCVQILGVHEVGVQNTGDTQ